MDFADVFWIILFVSLGVVAARVSLRLYGTIATPLSFYILGNSISAVLFHLRLLAYPDASIQVHALVLLSMLLFASASVVVSKGGVESGQTPDNRGLIGFFYATGAISIIGWVLPLSIMLAKHGVAYLMANLWLLEYEFQMQYIGHLNVINILIFPLFVIKQYRVGVRKIDRILLTLSFLALFLAGIKSFLVYSIAAGMLAHSVTDPKGTRIWHLIGLGVVVVAFFVMYDKLIDVLGVSGLPGSSFPESLRFLERPYYYVTGAWPAMDMILQGQIEPASVPGFVTFQPFWKFVADYFQVVEPIPRALPFVPVGPYFFNVY